MLFWVKWARLRLVSSSGLMRAMFIWHIWQDTCLRPLGGSTCSRAPTNSRPAPRVTSAHKAQARRRVAAVRVMVQPAGWLCFRLLRALSRGWTLVRNGACVLVELVAE